MNKTERINFYICNAVVLGGIIFCVLFWCFKFQIRFTLIPCYFHDWLHLYCFGCGGTRAIKALLNFQLVDAFMCNPLVIYGILLFLYYYIGSWFRYFSHPWKKYFKYRKWMENFSKVILIGVLVLRNVLLVFWQIDYLGELKQFWIK